MWAFVLVFLVQATVSQCGLGRGDGENEGDGDGENLGLWLGEGHGLKVGPALAPALGEAAGLPLAHGRALGLADGLADALEEGLGQPVGAGDGVAAGLELGLGDGQAFWLKNAVTFIPALIVSLQVAVVPKLAQSSPHPSKNEGGNWPLVAVRVTKVPGAKFALHVEPGPNGCGTPPGSFEQSIAILLLEDPPPTDPDPSPASVTLRVHCAAGDGVAVLGLPEAHGVGEAAATAAPRPIGTFSAGALMASATDTPMTSASSKVDVMNRLIG